MRLAIATAILCWMFTAGCFTDACESAYGDGWMTAYPGNDYEPKPCVNPITDTTAATRADVHRQRMRAPGNPGR